MDTKEEFEMFRDSGDSWAETMSLWFGVAAELWYRGLSTPPHWEYSAGHHGRDGRDKDDYYFELLANESNQDLVDLGDLLCRHSRFLRFKGCDY